MRWTTMVAVAACGVVLSTGALAQRNTRAGGGQRGGSTQEDDLPPSVAPAIPTLAPTRGISGPRIEPGAVLCRSAADLRHRAEVNRRRTEGEPDAGDPLLGCRLMRETRGVEVVSREGLGLVQVRLKPGGEVGWTDVYLH